jgi:hypothetical protein
LPHLRTARVSGLPTGEVSAAKSRVAVSGLSLQMGCSEFLIFEDVQSMTSGRQLEKPLIFPREIQQNVSGIDAKHQEEKEGAFSNNAHREEHRHKTESTDTRSEKG